MLRPNQRTLLLLASSLPLFYSTPALALEAAQDPTPTAATTDTDGALKQIATFIEQARVNSVDAGWKTMLPKPPQLNFTSDKDYFWKVGTNQGDIKIKLLHGLAPMHASTVIYLSEIGFYDGLSFHRVIKNFMAQGGDPLGTGRGGPGFEIAGEVSGQARHDRAGTLSAANRGKGTPEGSQFFLTFKPTPHLDGVHTVYGYVVDGLDTLRKLEAQGSPKGPTLIPLMIESSAIEVSANPLSLMEDDFDSADPAIAGLRGFITNQEAEGKINRKGASWKTKLPKPPKQGFEEGKTYHWNLITNKGAIQVELMPGVAPMHTTATIYLSMLGFYDGLSFHRVIPGFMAQGGCPLGTGTGYPGFKMSRELSADVKHSAKGILSAANTGGEGTDGSQFFLTFGPTPNLDGGYTVYGKVTSGLDVLSELEKLGSRSGRTRGPLTILKTTITVD